MARSTIVNVECAQSKTTSLLSSAPSFPLCFKGFQPSAEKDLFAICLFPEYNSFRNVPLLPRLHLTVVGQTSGRTFSTLISE